MNQTPDMSIDDFKFALQSAGMGTWDIDLTNNAVYCSPEMLNLWGVKAEEFRNDRSVLQGKVHPEDLQAMKEAVDRAILNESIYDLEYRILPAPGEMRWVRSRGRCTYSSDSRKPVRLSGVVFDVTAMKEKDLALAIALKDRERFLIVAGHELKTPLTGMQLQLQALESELKDRAALSDRVGGSISRQKEQIWRLARIIDNICEHSQLSEECFQLKLESLDIVKFVGALVNRFANLANANHTASIEFYSTVTELPGKWDKFRIEHVVLNLLSNALRYAGKKPIRVFLESRGDHVYITVKDEGPGLSFKEQEKIFDRVGASGSNGGMGLGLYVCQRIMHSHGGKITVKSAPGAGAEFMITLPCKK